jgi:hypothetical protein
MAVVPSTGTLVIIAAVEFIDECEPRRTHALVAAGHVVTVIAAAVIMSFTFIDIFTVVVSNELIARSTRAQIGASHVDTVVVTDTSFLVTFINVFTIKWPMWSPKAVLTAAQALMWPGGVDAVFCRSTVGMVCLAFIHVCTGESIAVQHKARWAAAGKAADVVETVVWTGLNISWTLVLISAVVAFRVKNEARWTLVAGLSSSNGSCQLVFQKLPVDIELHVNIISCQSLN